MIEPTSYCDQSCTKQLITITFFHLECSSEEVTLLDLIFCCCRVLTIESQDIGKFRLGIAARSEVGQQKGLVDGGGGDEDVFVDSGWVEILKSTFKRHSELGHILWNYYFFHEQYLLHLTITLNEEIVNLWLNSNLRQQFYFNFLCLLKD